LLRVVDAKVPLFHERAKRLTRYFLTGAREREGVAGIQELQGLQTTG
jgi:hypothetical protein